mmetsp:Transcript_7000/g.13813  ORF Transcript_7000/g.13813 Transcript_7000/m.13813 type:complete len:210 (+) Transcript_7000:152-781(+)
MRKIFRSLSDKSSSSDTNPNFISNSFRKLAVVECLFSMHEEDLFFLSDFCLLVWLFFFLLCVFFLSMITVVVLEFLLFLPDSSLASSLFKTESSGLVPVLVPVPPIEWRLLREAINQARIMTLIFLTTWSLCSFATFPFVLSSSSSSNGVAGCSMYSHPSPRPFVMSHQSPRERLYSRIVTPAKETLDGRFVRLPLLLDVVLEQSLLLL